MPGANRTPLPHGDNQNSPQTVTHVPWGTKSSLVENHCVKSHSWILSFFPHTLPPNSSINPVSLLGKWTFLALSIVTTLMHATDISPGRYHLSFWLVSSSPSPHLYPHSVPATLASWLPLTCSKKASHLCSGSSFHGSPSSSCDIHAVCPHRQDPVRTLPGWSSLPNPPLIWQLWHILSH